MAENIVITDQMLSNPLRIERYVHVTVRSSAEEQSFAQDIEKELVQLISQRRIDAKVYSQAAKAGNAYHPIIVVYNNNYGSIGLLLNKNILTAIMLQEGKTSQAMYRKEYLTNASQHETQRQANTATDGCCGCMEFLYHGHESNKASREAKEIQYDPLELASEEAWKRDVLACIDDIGKGD